MRYNTTYQALADKYAQEKGYEAATYCGSYYDFEVYCGLYKDNIPRPTGAPTFILMDEKCNFKFVCNFEETYLGSFDIMHKTCNFDDSKRIEMLYDSLISKLETGNYSADEYQYLLYLQALDLHNWDTNKFEMLSKSDVLAYLDASLRIGEEIAIFKNMYQGENEYLEYFFVGFRDKVIKYAEDIEKEYHYSRNWEMLSIDDLKNR